MSLLDAAQVCKLIDAAPEQLREYAQHEQNENLYTFAGYGLSSSGWSYGAAKDAAYYLVDGLKDEDTSNVCWNAVGVHLDNILPLDYCRN